MSWILIIVIAAIVLLFVLGVYDLNKKEKPSVTENGQFGGNGDSEVPGNNAETSESQDVVDEGWRPEFRILGIGYGLDSVFVKGATFYEGNYVAGQAVYVTAVARDLEGSATVVSRDGLITPWPRIEFGCYVNGEAFRSCQLTNEQRQSVAKKKIAEGDLVYMDMGNLGEVRKGAYLVVTLACRWNRGSGWSRWENMDAVNIRVS